MQRMCSTVKLFKIYTVHRDLLKLCLPSSVLSSTLSEMASVRAELLTYFTHILLGDALAAEYLILHLISNVYVNFNL